MSSQVITPTLADDETAEADEPRLREHFIPIRRSELLELLCAKFSKTEPADHELRQLAAALEELFHASYRRELEELKDAYAHFNPDADTEDVLEYSVADRHEQLAKLFKRFKWLLERGNFHRLGQQEIEHALEACSHWGLNLEVDFSVFECIEIYARGHRLGTRVRRRLQSWMRLEEVSVPTFQRLVIIFKLREQCQFAKYVDSDSVYIKFFKDIPKMDLEMLLPGTRVRMKLLDRCKIVVPTLSGIVISLWKLVPALLAALTMGFSQLMAFLGIAGGTIGYGVRSFMGYQRTKQKYQLSLTESLYFQNLDNNAGVLFRLLDEAEEQEAREALLAYAFLLHEAPPEGWTAPELDAVIEAYLSSILKHEVDFEVGDALEKLVRAGAASVTDDRYTAQTPATALAKIRRAMHQDSDGDEAA